MYIKTKKWQGKKRCRIWELVNWISVDFFFRWFSWWQVVSGYAFAIVYGHATTCHTVCHNVVYCPCRAAHTACILALINQHSHTVDQSLTKTIRNTHTGTCTRPIAHSDMEYIHGHELIMFNWMETMRNKYSEYSGNCLAVQWVRTNAIYSMVAWSIHMLSLFSGFSIRLDIPEIIDFDRYFFSTFLCICFWSL